MMQLVLQRSLLLLLGLFLSVVLSEGLLQLGALVLRFSGRTAAEQDTGGAELRVLALGDSNTYGLYLEPDQAYPVVMGRMWQSKWGEGSLDVVNAGVPGANSSKLRDELERLIRTFRPNVVTVMVGVNDLWTESVQTDLHRTATPPFWKRFRLYTLFRLLTSETTEPRFALEFSNPENLRRGRGTVRYGEEEFSLGWTRAVPAGIADWPTTLMQNLREMNVQARAAGVHLVLITYASEKQFYGQANRVIRHAARQHNLSLLDVRPSFQRACPAGDCKSLYFKSLHPTEKGHILIARALRRYLERQFVPLRQTTP